MTLLKNAVFAVSVLLAHPAIADESLSAKGAINTLVGRNWKFNCPRANVSGIGTVSVVRNGGDYRANVQARNIKGLGPIHEISKELPVKLEPEYLDSPLKQKALCGELMAFAGCFVIERQLAANSAFLKLYYFQGQGFFGLQQANAPSKTDYCMFWL